MQTICVEVNGYHLSFFELDANAVLVVMISPFIKQTRLSFVLHRGVTILEVQCLLNPLICLLGVVLQVLLIQRKESLIQCFSDAFKKNTLRLFVH